MPATDPQSVHNLPKHVYLEYIKLFPITRSPEIRTYTTLILTLLGLIGFSVFAISPTIRTILELRRTLADERFANESLETKIAAIQSLQQQYSALGASLTRVSEAIPNAPEVSSLLAKIQTLVAQSGMRIVKLEALEVELTKQGKSSEAPTPSSFVFTLNVSGSYAQLTTLLQALHRFDRIVTIDSLAITREEQTSGLTANIRARAYFHPEVIGKKGATAL
jgi:Tfp pilus assembly protein PilO